MENLLILAASPTEEPHAVTETQSVWVSAEINNLEEELLEKKRKAYEDNIESELKTVND